MKLRTCGVPGHPVLTPEEQELPQFWDGAELIEDIQPGSKIRYSNVDRILHRAFPNNRLVLFEHKHRGEWMSDGQRYLHDMFLVPTLAEVWHVVYSERDEMRPAAQWALEETRNGHSLRRGGLSN